MLSIHAEFVYWKRFQILAVVDDSIPSKVYMGWSLANLKQYNHRDSETYSNMKFGDIAWKFPRGMLPFTTNLKKETRKW